VRPPSSLLTAPGPGTAFDVTAASCQISAGWRTPDYDAQARPPDLEMAAGFAGYPASEATASGDYRTRLQPIARQRISAARGSMSSVGIRSAFRRGCPAQDDVGELAQLPVRIGGAKAFLHLEQGGQLSRILWRLGVDFG
jgi:hypothetical protein